MAVSRYGRMALGGALVVAGGGLVAGCGSGPASAAGCAMSTAGTGQTTGASATVRPAGSWPYPNGDLANSRDAAGSLITSANVRLLRPTWTFRLRGTAAVGVRPYGSLAANPVVRGGVVYVQDLDANVYALDLATGRLRWEYVCNQPVKSGPGPNGVAVSAGAVYGATSTAVFALSAATGRTIWVDTRLLRAGEGSFGIQPQVAGGRVYLASQYGSAPGGGVLLALDAATGRLLWRFDTAVGPAPGVRALGLGSGGAWETPLVSPDGSVTYGTGNPYQTAAAALAHPARLLYTDSDVNLDAATGALRWYYQGVPNDFKDYDMQTSPIAASVDGTPVVIGAGKMGEVYEMDAATGGLRWKTPVGEHNGHDNDSLLALEHKITLTAPYTILPGSLGGVLTNLAVAGGTFYVATLDLRLTYPTLKLLVAITAPGRPTGEIEALSLATGRVEWDTKVAQLTLGAVTVSNDLVFATLYDGVLLALDRRSGTVVDRLELPTSTNAPIAVAGNAVIVPAGGPRTATRHGHPQLIAYAVP